MKKLIKIITIVIFTFYAVIVMLAEIFNSKINYKYSYLDKLSIPLEDAIKKLTILINRGILLDDVPEGISILQYGDEYIDEAIVLLNKNLLSKEEILVIIELMQFVKFKHYIKFFEACTGLYVNGILSEYEIWCVIHATNIIKSFYKPRVIRCLKKIKKKANSLEFDSKINSILSGHAWVYILCLSFFSKKSK